MALPTRVPFLDQLYYHIALPRNVPGQEDGNLRRIEEALLTRLTDATSSLHAHTMPGHQRHIRALQESLTTCKSLNVDGMVTKSALLRELRNFSSHKMLILHASAQNCALLVYEHSSGSAERHIIFEAFETSATCNEVLASKSALLWDFPGCAVSVPYKTFSEDSFQESLAAFMEQASTEYVTKFSTTTCKAAASIPEIRDTTDPALISGLLMTILEASGHVVQVPILRKRVRDTVCFEKARKPWRRSPFYLVVRVAMQRYLYRLLGVEIGRMYYKCIMCRLLSQLLEEVLKRIPFAATHYLRQKLGRRLAKLDSDGTRVTRPAKEAFVHLLRSLEPSFDELLRSTGGFLKKVWRNHRQKYERKIPLLRTKAYDSELILRLNSSGKLLRGNLLHHANDATMQPYAASELLERYERSSTSVKPYMKTAHHHVTMSRHHEDVVIPAKASAKPEGPEFIMDISKVLQGYVRKIKESVDGYPDQKSQMLLHLFELWVLMDKVAVQLYPLLKEYHSGFDNDILDPIQLLTLEGLTRVQNVQMYLADRNPIRQELRRRTIFDDPSDDCFAVRYYDDFDASKDLFEMRQDIEERAAVAHDDKKAEWESVTQRYENLIEQRNEIECIRDPVLLWDGRTDFKHRWPCKWHALQDKANGLRIKIYEHPLPNWEPAAKATLFELRCPEDFAAYRDVTRLILSTLCLPPVERVNQVSLIRDYSQLRPYANDTKCQVVLASVEKAHLKTHYSGWDFPIDLSTVIRSCGLKPRYYDFFTQSWTNNSRNKASLWHHFPVMLSNDSPFQVLGLSFDSWPSSNHIEASQADCPTDVNMHEFMAWQGLLTGTHSRWYTLLRELGSTNLNFSSEATWTLIHRLCVQVGPSTTSTDPRRDIHSALLDTIFCSKLLQQIQQRLDAIHRNWREPVQMDILITILSKVASLSSAVRSEAKDLLRKARLITDSWRTELQSNITDNPNVTCFAIWASLLCKRTVHFDRYILLDTEALRHFVDASISLHYNLTGIDSMPYNLRNAIIQDVLFAYENREFIKNAILVEPAALVGAVDRLWHIPQDQKAPNLVPQPITEKTWFLLTCSSDTLNHSYSVHYNYVYGALLIDGKEMGSLPLEYRSHSSYRQIFGRINPIVFPSPLPGMSFTMSECMRNGHRIHLGFRDNGTAGKDLVIRAVQKGQILELVPRGVFGPLEFPDLPEPMLVGCYHWLNIGTGDLEIRRQDIWASKPGNWWIFGIRTGRFQAIRSHKETKETRLLDASSAMTQNIVRIFESFEGPTNIVVFASRDGRVTVELKRLELSFFITDSGLLHSKRLGAFIPLNQDAGTWYGLKSKIVIQSAANLRQKSIIVPLGKIQISKESSHVSVDVETGSGVYLKFGINEVLGRIECPPEPRLLYTKALFHAYTSHVICDPLTNRTGSDEAIYLLQTGSYLPWSPLIDINIDTLRVISNLSPLREYYPKDKQCMESIIWNPDIPISMQDDRYRAVVETILRRSCDLSHFFLDHSFQSLVDLPLRNPHLESRALSRYHTHKMKEDMTYHARDTRKGTRDRENVMEVSKLLLRWRSPFLGGPSLITLFLDAPVVGGYNKFFQKNLLTDHLIVDIRAEWGALVQKVLSSSYQDRYRLMFLFASMSFNDDANMELILVLIAFAMIPEMAMLEAPRYPVYYHFRADGAPKEENLVPLIARAKMPFTATGFKRRHAMIVAESKFRTDVEQSCKSFASSIREQWPDPELDPKKIISIDPAHLDVDTALADISAEWVRLTRNHELALHLGKVQEILDRVASTKATMPDPQHPCSSNEVVTLMGPGRYPMRGRDLDDLTLSRLLRNTIPTHAFANLSLLSFPLTSSSRTPLVSRPGNLPRHPHNHYDILNGAMLNKTPSRATNHMGMRLNYQVPEIKILQNLVASFEGTSSFVQSRYAKELKSSISALQEHIGRRTEATYGSRPRIAKGEIDPVKKAAIHAAETVLKSLFVHDPQAKWLQKVDLWPRMTIIDLLSELRSTSGTTFGDGSREALVAVGLAISKWQHLLRIQDAQKRHKKQQEQDELKNVGHTNWSPLNYPDWLLLEIDGDILLREEQVQVALATIAPESGENSVLQLLMGKGKTSCILPMVATVLANKVDLARIVVPRPLLLQSAQVMQAKLGGLVNREIMHVPFSRKTPTNQALMRLHRQLHERVKDNSGIILALPEHVLSFKLSGMQQLCDDHLDDASTMIRTQNWLDKNARDVLDECDVSFAIRTQLIYPSGSQMTVDGHPSRWQVTEILLHHVKDFLPTIQSRYRRSIEIVERGTDSFPLVYFLRKDAEDYLILLLVRLICAGQAHSILPCAELPEVVRQDVKDYISRPTLRNVVTRRVIEYFWDKEKLLKTVTLLRGLFVHRILISSLKKRWNVQYGLHGMRAPIAVPYLAKGVPSPTAEWGHPDVAIVLTCLSFYYQGLTISQFKQAFEQLVRSDEPSVEYEKWILNVDIPHGLDEFTALNVDDNWQLTEIHRFVRYNATLINFYLNNFVFPKYAKTFSLKLQASGWNLFPSISAHAKGCRVSGFSGTNDSRHQLPMLIKQADLPHLAHTNAEVPFYLLAVRNQGYVRMVHPTGSRWNEIDLLENLSAPSRRPPQELRYYGKVRILIDAGAQILEHSNRDFAAAWLERDYDAAAAVYFDDDHRAWVLYRNSNKRTPLLASPFADSLDRCLVYLDESHCRGTDLKLPADAKAALTLGPHLTKDALVQAAMRLRLLGQTQSVIFYSPPEVHQGILDRLKKDESFRPDSAAVLQWVIGQTCDAIEQQDPSYFAQTMHYLKQEQAQLDYPGYLQDRTSRDAFLAAVRVKETMSLKKLYEPKMQRSAVNTIMWNQRLLPFADALQLRKKHFQDRGSAVHASILEEVEIEQEREAEREVENEVEDVRETQRPPRFSACSIRSLHEDIKHFATNGRLVAGSDAYKPMFSVIKGTALGAKHGISMSMNSNLWVSKQFTRTVETYESNDNYLRPCHWVVWSSISQKALVISPEEANELIPILRSTPLHEEDVDGSVHLIVYSAPVTRRMLHFNRLDYYAVPRLPANFKVPIWLRVELGILSGRLHLEWDEYYDLLGYLGLSQDLSLDPQKQAFAQKPLTFLHEWIALRRKGQDFEHTPMGFVTTGKPLTANHPFFRAPAHDCDPDIRPQVARMTSGRADEADVEDDDGDHDDDEFVPAVEHIDDSDVEDEPRESNVEAELRGSDNEGAFVDAHDLTQEDSE
ncbi:Nn.00g014680.m01.CDS01 [Neocucurbitaria sp. VM-36]